LGKKCQKTAGGGLTHTVHIDLLDDIFVLPGVITSLCLDTVSALMGVGHLLLPAQLPGTHWAMICMIRHLACTDSVSVVCLKLGCFQSTDTYNALEVSQFWRYITYLLSTLVPEWTIAIQSSWVVTLKNS